MRIVRSILDSRRHVLTLGLAVAATLFSTLAGPRIALAQDPGFSDADQKALASYQITTEKLDKLNAINKKLAAALKDDPQIGKELAAGKGMEAGSSLEAGAAQFEKTLPHTAAIIKAGGLETREYLLATGAVMIAGMGAQFKKASPTQPLPDFVSAANVEFAEKNPDALEEFKKNMGALDAAGKATGGDAAGQ